MVRDAGPFGCTYGSQPCCVSRICEGSCQRRFSRYLLCLGRVELVSWKPRAFLYHNFLSLQECQHIMQEAKPVVMIPFVNGEGFLTLSHCFSSRRLRAVYSTGHRSPPSLKAVSAFILACVVLASRADSMQRPIALL